MGPVNCWIEVREREGRKDGRGAPAPEGTPGAFLFAMKGELLPEVDVLQQRCEMKFVAPPEVHREIACLYAFIH